MRPLKQLAQHKECLQGCVCTAAKYSQAENLMVGRVQANVMTNLHGVVYGQASSDSTTTRVYIHGYLQVNHAVTRQRHLTLEGITLEGITSLLLTGFSGFSDSR